MLVLSYSMRNHLTSNAIFGCPPYLRHPKVSVISFRHNLDYVEFNVSLNWCGNQKHILMCSLLEINL